VIGAGISGLRYTLSCSQPIQMKELDSKEVTLTKVTSHTFCLMIASLSLLSFGRKHPLTSVLRRCVDVLIQHGFDVTILEARSRIGGRVHRVQMTSGHEVDMGANWIHGTDNNPILDLAKKTSTPTHSVSCCQISLSEIESSLVASVGWRSRSLRKRWQYTT
jgi:hypothetical protein